VGTVWAARAVCGLQLGRRTTRGTCIRATVLLRRYARTAGEKNLYDSRVGPREVGLAIFRFSRRRPPPGKPELFISVLSRVSCLDSRLDSRRAKGAARAGDADRGRDARRVAAAAMHDAGPAHSGTAHSGIASDSHTLQSSACDADLADALARPGRMSCVSRRVRAALRHHRYPFPRCNPGSQVQHTSTLLTHASQDSNTLTVIMPFPLPLTPTRDLQSSKPNSDS
jgi:hypothetical protein